MIDNRSVKHPAETETVDGRSVDECLQARSTGVPQDLACGTSGASILSPFGMGFATRGADSQGRPNESSKEADGSSLRRRCITFSLSVGIATGRPPRESRMDPIANS